MINFQLQFNINNYKKINFFLFKSAVFAKEVLNNKNTTSMEDSLGLSGGHSTSFTHHHDNISSMKSTKLSSMSTHRRTVNNSSSKKNAFSAPLASSRRDISMPSAMTEVTFTKSARTLRDTQTQNTHCKHNNNFLPVNLPSHPIGYIIMKYYELYVVLILILINY